MPNLKKNIQINIPVSPKDLALLFCELDSEEQALFFSEIGKEVETWPSCNFDLQMLGVFKSVNLTQKGLEIMRIIGEYSHS